MTDEEEQQDLERMQRHTDALGEHFDTVQIFCTRRLTDGSGDTAGYHEGTGNWYARIGQISEWVTRNDQRVRNDV